jgi:hypothetical protein
MLTAQEVVDAPSSPESVSALNEARAFLYFLLKDGPVHSNTVKLRAREALVSDRTLRRAKKNLGVRARRVSNECPQYWVWELPHGRAADRLHREFQQKELDDLAAHLFHGDDSRNASAELR